MRSAPCAWAPSHTFHAMPPRITRNSHRPRASDRTMVDLEHQFGLPLFRTRWHRHHPRRKLMSMGNRPSFSREAQLQWAGSRETNLASGRGRTFFLTSLFIELIDPHRAGFRALTPSMRRPVGVKGIRFGFCWPRCFFPTESPLSPPFHPHSSMSALLRSVQVGCSRFSRCCHLIIDLGSISKMKAGPGV